MHIGVIGVNYRSSEIFFREQVIDFFGLYSFSLEKQNISYVALLTCNRFEVYFSTFSIKELSPIKDLFLENFEKFSNSKSLKNFYFFFKEECFFHLAKVTAGFDSSILGEAEIQGQVKRSYLNASSQRELCSDLHFLFQKSLKIGKKIRTRFPQKILCSSLEKTLYNLCLYNFSKNIIDFSFLLVGFSEINRKIFQFFLKENIRNFSFCSSEKNQNVILNYSSQIQIKFISKQCLLKSWHNYDIVIFACDFKQKFELHNFLERRITKTKIIFDLGHPRHVASLTCNNELKVLDIDYITGANGGSSLKMDFLCSNIMNIEQEVKKNYNLFLMKSDWKSEKLAVSI